jgi:Xaa-Pro aminopeptidase
VNRKTSIPSPYAERIAAVREEIESRGVDALLIQSRTDQFYLTGFTGEDGGLLLTPRQVVLLTDSRFDESADRKAPYAKKIIRKSRGPAETAKIIRRHKLAVIGYDPHVMSVYEFTALKKELSGVKLRPLSGICDTLRQAKTDSEVDAISHAVVIAEQAFKATLKFIRPGRSEQEVAAKLDYEMRRRGATGSAFGPIVASGPNASLPHHEPGSRLLEANEGILIDWGARADWYVSDLTRMVWLGRIPPRMRKICDVVTEALAAGIDAVVPGKAGRQVDAAARKVITNAGFGKQFGHALGHGIGLMVHESPRLAKTSEDELEPGMVVTIEPGIYLPGVGGVRLEEDVLVTESGCEVLSTLPLEFNIAV